MFIVLQIIIQVVVQQMSAADNRKIKRALTHNTCVTMNRSISNKLTIYRCYIVKQANILLLLFFCILICTRCAQDIIRPFAQFSIPKSRFYIIYLNIRLDGRLARPYFFRENFGVCTPSGQKVYCCYLFIYYSCVLDEKRYYCIVVKYTHIICACTMSRA